MSSRALALQPLGLLVGLAGATFGLVQVSEPEPPQEPGPAEQGPASGSRRRTMTTVFGWIAGGSSGLLLNFLVYRLAGEGYPLTWTTFIAFVAGAFGGMALADRLGERGFRVLALAAGILLAFFAVLVVGLFTGIAAP